MRKLYWKIFVSFWLLTSVVVVSTMAITGMITRQSSIPVSERIFINSYANAAVATYESGHDNALKQWLKHIELSKHLTIFLLSSNGNIVSSTKIPPNVKALQKKFLKNTLPDGIFRLNNFIVSHEILTLSQKTYRLVAQLHTPISHLTKIPWAGMSFVLVLAITFSGFVCYLLSLYLTKPLRSLRLAAKSIAFGDLKTRVNTTIKNRKDEIAELGNEFDVMAEHIEQLILSKERLLQDISHELRSPLARLQIAIALAQNDKNSERESAFIRMETEIGRLDILIGEILSLSKLLSPDIQLQKTEFRLDVLIDNIIEDANFEFSKTKTKAVSVTEPIMLNADEKLIYHAIENIIRNALKYTRTQTEVTVILKMQAESICIEISDQGPGVPEHSLNTIFNPFHRVDSSREKSTGGYGLGLSIAKKAIALHHGKILAENIQPEGLKVTVLLPESTK